MGLGLYCTVTLAKPATSSGHRKAAHQQLSPKAKRLNISPLHLTVHTAAQGETSLAFRGVCSAHNHVLTQQVSHNLLSQTRGDSLMSLQVVPVRSSSTVHGDERAKMLLLRAGALLQDKTQCSQYFQSCPYQHFLYFLRNFWSRNRLLWKSTNLRNTVLFACPAPGPQSLPCMCRSVSASYLNPRVSPGLSTMGTGIPFRSYTIL